MKKVIKISQDLNRYDNVRKRLYNLLKTLYHTDPIQLAFTFTCVNLFLKTYFQSILNASAIIKDIAYS